MTHSTTSNKSIVRQTLKLLLAGLFWVGVWELVYIIVDKDVIIASPADTALRILSLAGKGEFWLICGASLVNILIGYLAGIIFGSLSSLATYKLKTAETVFAPLLYVIRATPVASFILLAYFWMSNDLIPAFISFLMVVPIVWGNLREGFLNADKDLLEMAKIYRFSAMKRLLKIELPAVIPYFLSGCRTALGLAWKAGIAAEALVRTKGRIGNELQNAKILIETVDIFAWTVVIILLSVVLEKLFVTLFDAVISKRRAKL